MSWKFGAEIIVDKYQVKNPAARGAIVCFFLIVGLQSSLWMDALRFQHLAQFTNILTMEWMYWVT
jgi:hypothetical protein